MEQGDLLSVESLSCLVLIGQSFLGVDVASEQAQNRGGQMEGAQGESKTTERSWGQMSDKTKFPQEREKSGSGMQKDSDRRWYGVPCKMVLQKKKMRRYKGTFDIFFRVEHRMRKEEMEGRSTKKPNEVGDLQPMRQGSPTKRQAVRIASVRREECLRGSGQKFGGSHWQSRRTSHVDPRE